MAEHEKASSEESFEFVETPPAPRSEAAAPDCGVRTTDVSIRFPQTITALFEYQSVNCKDRMS
jgi:hypothetical protein